MANSDQDLAWFSLLGEMGEAGQISESSNQNDTLINEEYDSNSNVDTHQYDSNSALSDLAVGGNTEVSEDCQDAAISADNRAVSQSDKSLQLGVTSQKTKQTPLNKTVKPLGANINLASTAAAAMTVAETGAHHLATTARSAAETGAEQINKKINSPSFTPSGKDLVSFLRPPNEVVDNVNDFTTGVRTVLDSAVEMGKETAYFAMDRSKTFTDHYVTGLIMKDDLEFQHYHQHQSVDSLDDPSKRWKLKCYLASLSWYQKQLIKETRSLVEEQDDEPIDQGYEEIDIHEGRGAELPLEVNLNSYDLSTKPAFVSRAQTVRPTDPKYSVGSPSLIDAPAPADDVDSDEEALKPNVFPNSAGAESFNSRSNRVNMHALLGLATAGDAVAQQQLSQLFMPPPFMNAMFCMYPQCNRVFSVTCFRHHCRHCGFSFCSKHADNYHRIQKFGFTMGTVRVCDACYQRIETEEYRDRFVWRMLRLKAFYQGELIPYFEKRVDRAVDKVYRVAAGTLHVIKTTVCLNYPARIIIETIDVLRRYGLSGLAGVLMRQDFVEAVETLKRISGLDKMFSISLHELTACIYYKLAIERGLRGCSPTAEAIAHDDTDFSGYVPYVRESNTGPARPVLRPLGAPPPLPPPPAAERPPGGFGCTEATEDDLEEIMKFTPMALTFAYCPSPVECERLAHTIGYDTLYFHNESTTANNTNNTIPGTGVAERPAFVLMASTVSPDMKEKVAVLAIRGTETIHDLVTDIRAAPEPFPPEKEEILSYIYNEGGESSNDWNIGVLQEMEELLLHNPDKPLPTGGVVEVGEEEGGPHSDNLHMLHKYVSSISTVAANTEGLETTTSPKPTTSRTDPSQNDWIWLKNYTGGNANTTAYSSYACGGMARASLWLLKEVGSTLISLYKAGFKLRIVGHSLGGGVAALLTAMLIKILPDVAAPGAGGSRSQMPLHCISYGCPCCLEERLAGELKPFVTTLILHDDIIARVTPNSIRALMKDLMVFRSEIFTHIQQDWEAVITRAGSLWRPQYRDTRRTTKEVGKTVAGTTVSSTSIIQGRGQSPIIAATADEDAGDEFGAQTVEEEVLLDLFLPGQVFHIYPIYGQYKIKRVPNTLATLRSIPVQGNIFRDHATDNIYNALCEVKAVRAVHAHPDPERPAPQWVPYNATPTCQCCHSKFTWHTTFRGEAQSYKERYNCRCCGALVCDPCSSHKSQSIPSLGLIQTNTRVCDTCYYSGAFVK